MRQHGKGRRCTWRKLHLAVNPDTQEITESTSDDTGQVEPLLDQVPQMVRKFYGDGAYDQEKVYTTLRKRGALPSVPPRRNRRIQRHGNCAGAALARDLALRQKEEKGSRLVYALESSLDRFLSPQDMQIGHLRERYLWGPAVDQVSGIWENSLCHRIRGLTLAAAGA